MVPFVSRLDARRINKIISPTRDSSPPIDDILAKFNNKYFFSTLDFASGYWQIPLDETVRKFTSFLYDGRSYQFRVVPFGLNVSNAAFGRGLEVAFSSSDSKLNNNNIVCPQDVHIYVDDILIASTTFEEHLQSLKWVFEKIQYVGMTLKFKKCIFLKNNIKFLGHFVSARGIVMDPEKVVALKEFPYPKSKKDLQSFFGFCNFYRKFSNNHSSLLFPLSHLLKKNSIWKFTDQDKLAFNKIKDTFSAQVLLTHPNFNLPFCIQTDAS